MATDGTERPDYGEGWDELRRRTLQRDGYACTRCGADERTLQAHHVIPRSAGGPDELDNLLTLCRPCHGVIHQHNRAFNDVRDEASLFPRRDAPAAVARMRDPDDQWCSRCETEYADTTELVAWTAVPSADEHVTLCKPCAGHLLERVPAVTRETLTSNHRFQVHELSNRQRDAAVRPSVFASKPVAIRRKPRTLRERLVDDTPIRFLCNHRGVRWALLVAVGYVLLLVALSL
ncbi:HNH endonuclease [Natrialbaceae archaeon A-arb3/5]